MKKTRGRGPNSVNSVARWCELEPDTSNNVGHSTRRCGKVWERSDRVISRRCSITGNFYSIRAIVVWRASDVLQFRVMSEFK